MTTALLSPSVDVARYGRLADLLELWSETDAEPDLADFLHELEAHAARVIESSDVHEIAQLRETYRRLGVRTARGGGEDAVQLGGLLGTLDRMLDAGAIAAKVRRSAELAQAQRSTLRERVLALLSDGQPRRPREIAAALSTGTPQTSRVLRELIEAGKVARAEQPAGDGDQRAHWYELT